MGKLDTELSDLEEQADALNQRWVAEKDRLGAEQKLKEQLDQARTDLENAQRQGDLAKAGELAYG